MTRGREQPVLEREARSDQLGQGGVAKGTGLDRGQDRTLILLARLVSCAVTLRGRTWPRAGLSRAAQWCVGS